MVNLSFMVKTTSTSVSALMLTDLQALSLISISASDLYHAIWRAAKRFVKYR